MPFSSAAAVVFVWPGLRFGMLRITAYGLCAAVGMVMSMALARRLARRRPNDSLTFLDHEAVWDAGLVAIISCFLASRFLLIVRDPITFLHYPLLVLALPSLTYGGIAVATLMVWAHLRRKRLALLPMLDLFAIPAVILAAWLELGHWLEGSEAGMPTTRRWGVHQPWASDLPVHPVALYGALTALILACALWFSERRQNRGRSPGIPGRLAAAALIAGGALAVGLSFCAQPLPYVVTPWLEPGQWTALGAMLAGSLLWSFHPQAPSVPGADLECLARSGQFTAASAELQPAEVR